MADRRIDDRDDRDEGFRDWRDRAWRSQTYGRGDGDRERSGELRSFDEGYRFRDDESHGRRGGYGEEERTAAYDWRGGEDRPETRGYETGYRRYGERLRAGYDHGPRGEPRWQDRDYDGASPAMLQGEYELDRRRYEERGAHEARGRGDDFLRRAGEKLSSWFGGRGDDRSHDEGRHRGRGPKNYQRPDERISDEVHQRLTDDPWVDASDISVSVSAGEVTLSGTVENREAKHRAERCVEEIPGVRHVQNNLRVEHGGFFTSPTRGFGDSAVEARMRGDEDAAGVDPTADTAATRTTTRRT